MPKVIKMECLAGMSLFLEDNSIDAIVTDPPYGLAFMNKKWDYEVPSVAIWEECLRVLKPGGYLLSFAGSRTYHRMAVNIEDAGFEIRDQIMWVYGSGFPKSLNVGEGRGTALKPAHEPIVMARKPFKGTVAANVAAHGTGCINIDVCRVSTDEQLRAGAGELWSHQREKLVRPAVKRTDNNVLGKGLGAGVQVEPAGRWPANFTHDGSDEVVALFPDKAGAKAPVTGNEPSAASTGDIYNLRGRVATHHHGDALSSAARFFYCAKTTKADRDEGMTGESVSAADMTGRKEGQAGLGNPRAGAGRTSGAKNNHPTVKPTALMQWLVRMVTPPGGKVLDPFTGSGSTGKAAVREGFEFIGFEMEADSVKIARQRINHEVAAKAPAKSKPDWMNDL